MPESACRLELLAAGTWAGIGVLGPEAFDAFDAQPFLELMRVTASEGDSGQVWDLQERMPAPR